ncbi:GH92 family glycosyl hydrolase [Moheibacter lacus]|uniref:Glycoside hydrolase family 92 protein n=1 Tax=Moheibacter lacus TaxID=2745851 RepID=A0A838ZT24_9FLAO|nr:GH92 family glycosyl hydrolase [Moheibacter lacus]MBA5630138.1 glycoside hydrolase family 92 protein [Moheibacter lacus]
MQKNYFLSLIFFPLILLAQNYHQYVNPFIGTGGHGHTFPGATLPFGMVQLSPDTRIDGSWDGCSGYHYSDNLIYGFSHTHLSGTGVSDYGDILLMPTMGVESFVPTEYSSRFSHVNEKASAGFYSVHLDKYDVDVELTTSTRVGFHKYKFNKEGKANIILDLNHRDKLLDGKIKIIDNKTIEVYRKSESWATNQQIWARIEFNQSMSFGKVQSHQNWENLNYASKIIDNGLIISRNVKEGDELMVKVSLSFTGFEGARLNTMEIKDWDFQKVKTKAEEIWNKELSKIEVKSTDKNKLTIFYTALYHTMLQPNVAQDLDGKYMGRDFKVHQAKDFEYFTVFSLWDTFRAAHPLYTLIQKRRTVDFIKTFIRQYEEGGRLPVWELAANETDCMIGYHSVSVIADAMMKGFEFDYEKVYEASKHSAMLNHLGLEAYKKNGFISIDDEHESVSKTVEYAYDDWCIAQMALKLQKMEDYHYFMERSQSWKNLFDPETKLFRPKKNGAWLTPFDGREVNNHFTEGNSWHYSFFAPHDIYGLIQFHGGNKNFEKKLDELFKLPTQTTGRNQVDITGLIGQYAHGNEPSHHVAYLYNYVGKPEKTKQRVHQILDTFYTNSPDGLIGNEDCGQMSAWYILSTMGIYAVTPGEIGWQTTTPYFDEIKINFEDGTSQIITKNTSKVDLHNLGFGNVQKLIQKDPQPIVPVPYFQYKNRSFADEMIVEIKSLNPEDTIYFINYIDGVTYKLGYTLYSNPVSIYATSELSSYIERDGVKSKIVSAQFYKRPHDYSIQIKSKVHPLYTADAPEALLDGIQGTENWRKGDWQGYQGTDFEAVIDLKKMTEISFVSANFLQDARPWILMPKSMKVYTSTDGKNFQLLGEIETSVKPEDEKLQIETLKVDGKTTARYIKVIAENYGELPESHISAGEPAYIFVDEILVE